MSNTRSDPKRCCRSDRGAKDAAVDPDILAEHDDVGVLLHRAGEGQVDGFDQRHLRHQTFPPVPRAADIGARQLGIEVIEHGLGGPRIRDQIAFDGGLDVLLAFGGELLLLGLAPHLLANKIDLEPRDRLLLPARLDLLRRTVASSVIRGRMIAEPIGDGLDKARPLAAARARRSPPRPPRARR